MIASKRTNKLAYYDAISRNILSVWSDFDHDIEEKILIRAADIILAVDPQPDKIIHTNKRSIQMCWELDDSSCLQFEVFSNNIKCMKVPCTDDKKSDYMSASFVNIPFDNSNEWIKEIVTGFFLTYQLNQLKDQEAVHSNYFI